MEVGTAAPSPELLGTVQPVTVQPDKDRQLGVLLSAGGVHVQVQAVLAHVLLCSICTFNLQKTYS